MDETSKSFTDISFYSIEQIVCIVNQSKHYLDIQNSEDTRNAHHYNCDIRRNFNTNRLDKLHVFNQKCVDRKKQVINHSSPSVEEMKTPKYTAI